MVVLACIVTQMNYLNKVFLIPSLRTSHLWSSILV
jgi:hypothetical protein